MFDIHKKVTDRYDDLDERKVEAYIGGLMKEFAASPEARPLVDSGTGLSWAAMMMEYGFNYPGCSPAEMSLEDFNEVVFQLIPRKVSTGPESAPEIINELRAFWQFLQRQYGLCNAGPILAALDPSAEKRLRKELANPANFGMAKSFVMQGMESGYDMTTQEGVDRFMQAYNAQIQAANAGQLPLVPLFNDDEDEEELPPVDPGPSPRARHEERRKARKRQRQARKRKRK